MKTKTPEKTLNETGPPAAVRKIIQVLSRRYPEPRCALNHDTPFQLLAATILSAQCTDERVNLVTPGLFARYPTAEALAQATQAQIEELVRSTGFFRNKAKSLLGCATRIVAEFDGQVPRDMDSLLRLPGVARKTANVVLGNSFGIASGIVCDTHVCRLSVRLGLTSLTQPEKIEQALMTITPPEHWINFSHWLIFHGRNTCLARSPRCEACDLADFCPRAGV